jgi:hypothetical protein
MKARRPGVSAVLLDEYAAGVSASSSASAQSGFVMFSLLYTSQASCAKSSGSVALPLGTGRFRSRMDKSQAAQQRRSISNRSHQSTDKCFSYDRDASPMSNS